MLPDSALFAGRVNLIGGPGSGCGKTAFAKAALASLRESGRVCALISAGMEGGATAAKAGRGKVSLQRGEVFVTAAAFLGSCNCLPEILEAVPGSSALGKLAIAKACRDGEAVLVGPERNEHLFWMLGRIVDEGWADTVIVDGAMNRITQAANLPDVRVFWAVRAGRSDCRKMAARMRHMLRLVSLPSTETVEPAAGVNGSGEDAQAAGRDIVRIEGPFTAAAAASLAVEMKGVVVDDFTKIFLDGQEFAAFLRNRTLAVARRVEFGGFSVALRDVGRSAFEELLGRECANAVVCWDAYADCASWSGFRSDVSGGRLEGDVVLA